MTPVKDLQRQHETIAHDKRSWLQRCDDLEAQRDEQRARAEASRTSIATALATLEPDERAAGKARKDTAAAEEAVAELEAALRIAKERIQGFEAAEERLARRLSALTTRQEVEALLKGYAALDRLWAPMLRQLQELVEHEDDVAALLRPRLGNALPTVSGRALLVLLIWRVNDQLGYPFPDLISREHMTPAAEHAAARFASVLQQLEAELAD